MRSSEAEGEITSAMAMIANGVAAPATHHALATNVLRLDWCVEINWAMSSAPATGTTWYLDPTARPQRRPTGAKSHGREASEAGRKSAAHRTKTHGKSSVVSAPKSAH